MIASLPLHPAVPALGDEASASGDPVQIYIGTPLAIGPPFAGFTWTKLAGTGGHHAQASADLAAGLVKTITQAFAPGSAQLHATIHQEVSLVARCSGQDPTAPLEATLVWSARGEPDVLYEGRAWLEWAASLDGTTFQTLETFELTRGWGERSWSGQDTLSAMVAPNTVIKPAFRIESGSRSSEEGNSATTNLDGGSARPYYGSKLEAVQIAWSNPPSPTLAAKIGADRTVDGWHSAPAEVSVSASETANCVRSITYETPSGVPHEHAPGWDQSAATFTVHSHTDREFAASASSWMDEAASLSYPVRVDTIAPDGSAWVTCERNGAGECLNEAVVRFGCSDVGVGCDASDTRYRVNGGPEHPGAEVTLREPGDHRITYRPVDRLDLVGSEDEVLVSVRCQGAGGDTTQEYAGLCRPPVENAAPSPSELLERLPTVPDPFTLLPDPQDPPDDYERGTLLDETIPLTSDGTSTPQLDVPLVRVEGRPSGGDEYGVHVTVLGQPLPAPYVNTAGLVAEEIDLALLHVAPILVDTPNATVHVRVSYTHHSSQNTCLARVDSTCLVPLPTPVQDPTWFPLHGERSTLEVEAIVYGEGGEVLAHERAAVPFVGQIVGAIGAGPVAASQVPPQEGES